MINIKGAAGVTKHTINRTVTAITNCCRFIGRQGLLFTCRDIYLEAQCFATPCVIEAIVSNIGLQYQPACCYKKLRGAEPTR